MLCVCAKQGMLTEGKSVSGMRKTPWRKNINEQFCHSQETTSRPQETWSSDSSSWRSEVEAQGQHGFQREAPCVAFAVLNTNGPRVPEKPTSYTSDLTNEVPCVVLKVAVGSHLRASAHNSEEKNEGLVHIEPWIPTARFSFHVKPLTSF